MRRIIAQLLNSANELDNQQLFTTADKLTKLAQELSLEEEWLRNNAHSEELSSFESAPEEIQNDFMLDMAEEGIHHDDWPDTWWAWSDHKAQQYLKQQERENQAKDEPEEMPWEKAKRESPDAPWYNQTSQREEDALGLSPYNSNPTFGNKHSTGDPWDFSS